MGKDSYNYWTSFLSSFQAEDEICKQLNRLELKRIQYVTCNADRDEIDKIKVEMEKLQIELEAIRKRICHRINYTPTGGNAD